MFFSIWIQHICGIQSIIASSAIMLSAFETYKDQWPRQRATSKFVRETDAFKHERDPRNGEAFGALSESFCRANIVR